MSDYYRDNGTDLERAIFCDEVTLRTWQLAALRVRDWPVFDRVTESLFLQRKMVFGALATLTTTEVTPA